MLARVTATRALLLGSILCSASSLKAAPKSTVPSPCATLPHSDHPMAHISNGEVDLAVFLPDAENGYYRSSRFDWSGIIGCASYRGHSYFGEWFSKYDPLISDAVTGPAEEFRADDGKELGYADAPAGGEFVKPGVGVLTKLKDEPYRFGTVYPIVDRGAWEVKVKARSITFTQHLRSKAGYSYDYTKILELNAAGSTFTLRHSLKNVGIKAIETNVYDHDFFMLDGKPTGAGDTVTFGFAPVAKEPLGDAAAIQGNQIVFIREPVHDHTAQGYLTGWEGKPGEYHVHVVDSSTGVGITQMSDASISNSYFWSTARTICPELYIPVSVQPKKSQQWQISYTLEAPQR